MLSGCLEESSISLKYSDPALVIEGKITNGIGPNYVYISYSSNFNDSISHHPVSDALVMLSDNQGNSEELELLEDGIYQSIRIQGTIGNTYRLEVIHDGVTYEAIDILGPVGQIDSISQRYDEGGVVMEPGYYVTLFAQKSLPDQINYYKWNLYQGDSLMNGREFLFFGSDEFTNSLNGLEITHAFEVGDSITWEIESITRQVYEYYLQLNIILNNDGIITHFRNINPPSNFDPPVLGVFQASAVSSKSLIIEE